MTWEMSMAFAIACFIAMALPGPGIFALVARALTLGARKSMGFILGMILGDLVMVLIALTGLAAIVNTMSEVMTLIRVAGGLYLIYMGIQLIRHRGHAHSIKAKVKPGMGFVSGLAITLSNPKVIVFYMAFLPQFFDLTKATVTDGAIIATIACTVLTLVLIGYAIAASRARSLFKSEKSMTWMNRITGGIFVGTGSAIAAS